MEAFGWRKSEKNSFWEEFLLFPILLRETNIFFSPSLNIYERPTNMRFSIFLACEGGVGRFTTIPPPPGLPHLFYCLSHGCPWQLCQAETLQQPYHRLTSHPMSAGPGAGRARGEHELKENMKEISSPRMEGNMFCPTFGCRCLDAAGLG